MCKDAIVRKIDFVKQLGIVLQGTVKPSEFSPPLPPASIPSCRAARDG